MTAQQKTTVFLKGEKTVERKALPVEEDNGRTELCILNIYPEIEYQEFGGFGGAVTDAVGTVLNSASPDAANEIIEAVFGRDGLRYGAVRTHIDSCDFSDGQYCAMNDPGDRALASFSISRDEEKIIPWIKAASRAAGFSIPVMLTPWTPPAFMKTNGSRTGGGRLKTEYYELWARYICRYISEYRQRDVNVRSISIQNEPNASQTWDSCLFTAEEERRFVEDALYPELLKEGIPNLGIYIWDHNKERAFDRALETIAGDAANVIEGVAVHWYTGDHFDALRLIHERFPDKKLIFTEGCIEYSRFDKNQLKNAQKYAHDIIGNFSAGLNASYDWNICLDAEGGPNYVGNYCEAPLMLNEDGTVRYMLSYDYIRHFSAYLEPGARRLAATKYTDKLDMLAFRNPDGRIVVILLNREKEAMKAVLRIKGMLIPAGLPPESIATVTIEE